LNDDRFEAIIGLNFDQFEQTVIGIVDSVVSLSNSFPAVWVACSKDSSIVACFEECSGRFELSVWAACSESRLLLVGSNQKMEGRHSGCSSACSEIAVEQSIASITDLPMACIERVIGLLCEGANSDPNMMPIVAMNRAAVALATSWPNEPNEPMMLSNDVSRVEDVDLEVEATEGRVAGFWNESSGMRNVSCGILLLPEGLTTTKEVIIRDIKVYQYQSDQVDTEGLMIASYHPMIFDR
jgi:hypothetical protein